MKKSFSILFVVMMMLSVVLVVPTTSAQEPLGSEGNPILVYFVPSGEAQVIVEGGAALAALLKDATGLNFEVYVPTSYPATFEAMCAAPDRSIGFIPAAGYVLANNLCGVQVAAKAIRNGWSVYWAQFVVRRDSDIYVLGDLEGKAWAYSEPTSTSGYIVPATQLKAMGITVSQELSTGGHNQTILAVYNGEVDFGTTYYSPPVMPGAPWRVGDLPEPFDLTVDESYIGEDGELYVGDVRVMDARRAARETAPDVMDKVRILAISEPIPNDTMSFGPEFPADVQQQITDALFALAEDQEVWKTTALSTSYSWTGIEPVDDAAFNGVRQWFDVLGLTQEDLFK